MKPQSADNHVPDVENHYSDYGNDARKFHRDNKLRRDQRVRRVAPRFGVLVVAIMSLRSAVNHHLSRLQRNASTRPRYVRCVFEEPDRNYNGRLTRLDLNAERYPSKRLVDSDNPQSPPNSHDRTTTTQDGTCQPQYAWQSASFPVCNSIHEFDLTDLHAESWDGQQVRLMAHGFWRDVWMVRETVRGRSERRVFKTLRYEHDYEERNYERHRRDAVAMERLTNSKSIVDIYAFCGNSGIFEYANGGDITDAIFGRNDRDVVNMTSLQMLQIATQVAMGIAAVHNSDVEGIPSMAHTDITPSQFVFKDGIYKLNDFNRARFLHWNTTSNTPCGYHVGKNPGKNRSPEEYKHEEQSEKVDVYSMGNIAYMLLTGLYPFEGVTEQRAQRDVIQGHRPSLPRKIREHPDPIIRTLREAMVRCHEQDSRQRATARQIERSLRAELYKHDPGAMKRWGLEP